jgi:replicative DNA helicase
LDVFTKGAFSGDLTVVAGESGGYKSGFASQMALANAREGKPVAFFSIEMTNLQLTERFYPVMGDIITTHMMRDPRLINLHTHIPEVKKLSAELKRLSIWLDDARQPINRLIARMRMMVRKFGIKLFVIDYFQLILPNDCRTEAEGLKGIAFALRDFMKAEPSTHVVLLSQYAKASGGARKGKQRRSREDLYGTSALHHAAQNVLLIGVESAKGKEPNEYLDAEFDYDKCRSGGTGRVDGIMLDRDHMRFMHPQPLL